ncbi:MAG TPA: hypothetical protein VG603_10405, partial [Chitinophagales bacterium]|nr:hypothetical protein [Chitinophagales bacterium]
IEFFNDNLSKYSLRFYFLAYLLLFYCSNYLFRPVRFVRTAINIAGNNPQSRGEHTMIGIIKQYTGLLRSKLRFKTGNKAIKSPSAFYR